MNMNKVFASCLLLIMLTACGTTKVFTTQESNSPGLLKQVNALNLSTELKQSYDADLTKLDSQYEKAVALCTLTVTEMKSTVNNYSDWQMGLALAGGAAGATGATLLAISSSNIAGAAIASGVSGVLAIWQAFYKDSGTRDPTAYKKQGDELYKSVSQTLARWDDGTPIKNEGDLIVKLSIKQKVISDLTSSCFIAPLP